MLTVLGEAVVDLVAEGERRFVAHPGGSPLNVAVGLGRLGREVTLAARLSGDAFGAMFREHLAAAGQRRGPEPGRGVDRRVERLGLLDAADQRREPHASSWSLCGRPNVRPSGPAIEPCPRPHFLSEGGRTVER